MYDNYNMLSFLYLCVNFSNQINNLFSSYGTFSILIVARARELMVHVRCFIYIYIHAFYMYFLPGVSGVKTLDKQ